MRLRLLAASVTLVVLSTSTWRVHAQQSSQARGATPLTMGQLALLLATPDSTLGASLRTALQSSDAGVRAIAARIAAYSRVSMRRWNLILDDGVVVQLPETGWQKQLDALDHLIIDNSILERDVVQIDLRSPTHYFFVLKNGDKKDVERGKET